MRLSDEQCKSLSALNAGNSEPLLLDIVHSASRAHQLPDAELDSLVNYARAVQHERDTRRSPVPLASIVKQINDAAPLMRAREDLQRISALQWIRREFDPTATVVGSFIEVTQAGWDAITADIPAVDLDAVNARSTFTGVPIRIVNAETTTALAADEDDADGD
ncbi:hypothetical protein [Curtobacterium oceanosedimentum]|uniref:hypothetical protein n=1 Tax=Curtobacterium oceanosedimentum TaxID=465820 RepID=UPI003390B73B